MPPHHHNDRDSSHMRSALRMAKRGLGTTAPNPSVGAVIVDASTGEIIARGWTQPGGRPHAETEAIRRAGRRAAGATMIVTLEPCSHQGNTGPCAQAIIDAGIARVVCALGDPDGRVAGRGLAMLRAAGIEVATGVGEGEARWLTLGHILRVTQQRPFVQLKMAVSADGLIAPGDGNPVWVTGPEARARAHLLRARSDAVMVGIGTVLADDPALSCRLPGLLDRSPLRVVLDSQFRTPATAKVLQSNTNERTLLIGLRNPDNSMPLTDGGGQSQTALTPEQITPQLSSRHLLPGSNPPQTPASGERWIPVTSTGMTDSRGLIERALLPTPVHVSPAESQIGLVQALSALAQRGITRLLVEGGPAVWRSFLDAGLVDEAIIFQGTGMLGASGRLPLGDHGIARFQNPDHWHLHDSRPLGGDRMSVYRVRRS